MVMTSPWGDFVCQCVLSSVESIFYILLYDAMRGVCQYNRSCTIGVQDEVSTWISASSPLWWFASGEECSSHEWCVTGQEFGLYMMSLDLCLYTTRVDSLPLCVCVRDITGRFRLAPWHTTPWRHALTLGCTSIRLLAKLRAYTISGKFLWLCLLDNFACIENAWQRCWHWRRDSLKRMTVRQRHEPCDCPNTIIYSCFFF